MKGLFIKDLLLLKNQKRTLPLLVLCGIVMSASMQPSSAIIYLAILGSMLCTGTISYDEMDHGYSFLFTLPVTRKTYVREKYLFSILVCLASMLIGFVVSLAVSMTKGAAHVSFYEDLLSFIAGAMLSAACMLGSMIPVRLKYGTEKSSTVLFLFFGLIAAAAFLLSKGRNLIPAGIGRFVRNIPRAFGMEAVILGLFIAAILILVISEQISERIVVKKEY